MNNRRHKPDDQHHQPGADQMEQAVECVRDAWDTTRRCTQDDIVGDVPALAQGVRHLQENDGDDGKPQELVDRRRWAC